MVAAALAVFASIALLAGSFAVGQGVARQVAASAEAVPVLRAVGMTRRQRTLALALPSLVAIGVGSAVGALAACAASPLFPVAIARLAEPHPGFRVDATVILAGMVLVAAILGVWALVSAGRRARSGPSSSLMRSVPGGSLVPLGPEPGLAARLGIRLALDRDRSERRVPSRTAIVGSVVAVLGVVGALVFSASLTSTIDHRARWGWTWSAMPDPPAAADHAALLSGLRTTPDLDAAGLLFTGQVKLDGRFVNALTFDPVRGSVAPTLVTGRLPTGPGEVALGGNVLSGLGVRVGDTVDGSAADGSLPASAGPVHTMRLLVVGQVVVPLVQNQDPGTGAVLTPDGFAHFAGLDGADQLIATAGQGNVGVNLLVRYPAGADTQATERRLVRHLGLTYSAYARPDPPGRLTNLRSITPITLSLAGFFGLVGLAGLVHALVVSVRRRRRDFAVLQAFGMQRSELRRLVRSQAVSTVAVAMVVGIPLGIVAGRSVWKLSIGTLGIVDTATIPIGQLAVVALGAAVLAVAVAVVPGRMVVRGGPGRALRAE